MYFNKIYASSTERIVTRSSSSNDAYDIELQHPQPRRRQISDHYQENDDMKDQHFARAYSVPSNQTQFYSSSPDQTSSMNNIVTIPTNLPSFMSPDPFITSSLPTVVEEK
ncbi:unnamed protein product [Adineta steineri]|uniref:Uncharacterized protein n=1 Tax=Adineta steineri TaxID=433720 RepID=A0A815CYT0_9BILA|nr:unnamed protein product [Adineta steineri]CAF3813544.1 unnamed protein product [Adineta steineri]